MADGEIEPVQLLYDEIELAEGEKGIFGATARVVTKVGVLDTEAFTRNLKAFLDRIGPAFAGAGRTLGSYELAEVEVSIAVSARGEVRLVGGVSSEVSGGVRLKFARRSPT